ncbi:MAG: type II toxin-antitoxin system tRNA(fMet)-specific endonuclease VapC [Thermodesulfobacteriota bacterium]
MHYMLDTNICIYIIKQKPAEVIKRLIQTELSQVGISSVTLSGLFYGAAKSARPDQNRTALVQFVGPLEVAAYDDEAARCYGDVRAGLEKSGRPIGSLGMLIAAHALSLGCVLVTNNEKEFERIPDLKIENWAKRKK